MANELMRDLPGDLPTFLARFGRDAQCRAHLARGRWPEGFRCAGCGHGTAYSHHVRLIEECAACGKQHSLLAGTIFEQTKTGLARWFLVIWLVTSSKGGISAMELQRQMGFGSYQTAWSWLHKIRKAMVVPDRKPLAERVEADETLVGGAKPGKRGRSAAGKTVVAGAVEAGRGKGRARRLGRLRLQSVADASAASLAGFLAANVAPPAAVITDGWHGYAGLDRAGYDHAAINLTTGWGDAVLRLPAIHLVFGLAKRWLLGTHRRWNRRSGPAGNGLAAARP
jgi:transposase-like protein